MNIAPPPRPPTNPFMSYYAQTSANAPSGHPEQHTGLGGSLEILPLYEHREPQISAELRMSGRVHWQMSERSSS